MSIHISPSKLEVIEGFIAVFDCNVYGNLIGEVKWSRDYEPLDYDKVRVAIMYIILLVL